MEINNNEKNNYIIGIILKIYKKYEKKLHFGLFFTCPEITKCPSGNTTVKKMYNITIL